jgi:sulfide dehydrogenase [flavocytochrome c] flavoprotein subunit
MLRPGGGLAGADRGQRHPRLEGRPADRGAAPQLEAMPDGGVFAISIPKVPYRCPPGPYERACMVASYLKQAKPKSKVLVLDANPEIQSRRRCSSAPSSSTTPGILEYRPNAELKEVAGTVAKLEFEDVKADVLNVIPPQRAGDIARRPAGEHQQPLGRRELADDGVDRRAGHPRAGRRHLPGAG